MKNKKKIFTNFKRILIVKQYILFKNFKNNIVK